jgi:hypothetical protein
MIIVLVSVALFADHRRNSVDDYADVARNEDLTNAVPDSLLRPNVRDGTQNGHPGGVHRPLPVRRVGRDVRKHR